MTPLGSAFRCPGFPSSARKASVRFSGIEASPCRFQFSVIAEASMLSGMILSWPQGSFTWVQHPPKAIIVAFFGTVAQSSLVMTSDPPFLWELTRTLLPLSTSFGSSPSLAQASIGNVLCLWSQRVLMNCSTIALHKHACFSNLVPWHSRSVRPGEIQLRPNTGNQHGCRQMKWKNVRILVFDVLGNFMMIFNFLWNILSILKDI